jgi:hypothetical protein
MIISEQLKLCHKISKVTLSKQSDPFHKSIFFFEVSLSSEVCVKLLVKSRHWIGLFLTLFTLPIKFYITCEGLVLVYMNVQSQNSCGGFKYKFYMCQPPAILTSIERAYFCSCINWTVMDYPNPSSAGTLKHFLSPPSIAVFKQDNLGHYLKEQVLKYNPKPISIFCKVPHCFYGLIALDFALNKRNSSRTRSVNMLLFQEPRISVRKFWGIFYN